MWSSEYIGLRNASKGGTADVLKCSEPNTAIEPSPERIVTGILQPFADRPVAALDALKGAR